MENKTDTLPKIVYSKIGHVEVGSLWDYDRSLCNSQHTSKLKVKTIHESGGNKFVEFEQKMAYHYGLDYFDMRTFKRHNHGKQD